MSAKTRTITLTGRRPVKIVEDEWPQIADGTEKDWDNTYEFQANRTWKADIRVRQHTDGRSIVYGHFDYDTAFQGKSGFLCRAGELLDAGDDVAIAIDRVAQELIQAAEDSPCAEKAAQMIRGAMRECIASLEPETI